MATMYVALLIAVAVVTLEARYDTAEDNMVKAIRFYDSLKRDVQLDDQLPNDDFLKRDVQLDDQLPNDDFGDPRRRHPRRLRTRKSKISRIDLKGATGREQVTVQSVGGHRVQKATLSKTNYKTFTFPASNTVRIWFMADTGDVFVKDPQQYTILFREAPPKWNCGTTYANRRCLAVTQGKLYWPGHYFLKKRRSG